MHNLYRHQNNNLFFCKKISHRQRVWIQARWWMAHGPRSVGSPYKLTPTVKRQVRQASPRQEQENSEHKSTRWRREPDDQHGGKGGHGTSQAAAAAATSFRIPTTVSRALVNAIPIRRAGEGGSAPLLPVGRRRLKRGCWGTSSSWFAFTSSDAVLAACALLSFSIHQLAQRIPAMLSGSRVSQLVRVCS